MLLWLKIVKQESTMKNNGGRGLNFIAEFGFQIFLEIEYMWQTAQYLLPSS